MKTSAEELLDKLELLYENIFSLLDGFQQASTTIGSTITVPIKKEDGTVVMTPINSFQKLQQELSRIDSNFKSLTSANNISYILQADGSISQYTKTSFMNAEFLSSFNFDGNNCIVDNASNIDDLVFPMVKLPIEIDSKIVSDIHCRILDITNGFENIKENPTLLDIDYLYNLGKVGYQEIDRTLSLQKEQVKYFGKFTIESIVNGTLPSTYKLILNSCMYTGLNTIGNSINLKAGDLLVSSTGSSKYQINEIDVYSKTLLVQRISGSELLQVGIDKIFFNETLPTSTSVVAVPIKPAKKYVIFLSTENQKNISFPSNGLKIDTSDYKVTYQNHTYTIDEFFSKYVTNFSEFLSAILNETSIPVNLGIRPAKPLLDPINFKVLQINKHLTDAKSLAQMTDLAKQKQGIQNDIDFKQSTINQTQQEIDTLKFTSVQEKTYRINLIITLRQEINSLKQNLLNLSRELDSTAISTGVKDNKPKYRAIGFWPIQDPIYSPQTKAQNIIKYDVQYRYLSKDVDTVDNTSYTMINNGKSVSVVFSSWNDLNTLTLTKVLDINGDLVWETPLMDSVDDININQLAISIKEGESIEIKVRSVSEAGYPLAPLKSEWSESIRIDFPADLKNNNISSVVNQNNQDLSNAEFNSILQNAGLLGHVAGTIKESDKTFLHSAKDIASGQYTPEQKNIPLDTVIANLLQQIDILKQTDTANNVVINLIDFSNESYVVKNNTTMELLAENYSDEINILDSSQYGSIIRKKAYIKIRNNNLVPIELKTLAPGSSLYPPITPDNPNPLSLYPQYSNVPVKSPNSLVQSSKQILYFRNTDLSGQPEDIFKLVKDKGVPSPTRPFSQNDMISGDGTNMNVVYLDDDNNIKICQLIQSYNTKFNAFTTESPLYKADNKNSMSPEFDRLKLYNENLKAIQYQSGVDPTDSIGLGFADNDFYAIGEYTTGAFLYPVIVSQGAISVVGNSTVSTLIIPKETEILIPVIFEYRMTDRFGNINGIQNFDYIDTLEYDKKIGIDILLNNETFKFDILVKAKFKSKVSVLNSVNVTSITSSFANESPETLT